MKASKAAKIKIYVNFYFNINFLTLIWVCVCVCVGGGVGGNFIPPPSWFSLNNSRTVKAVTLEFCSIQ